MNKINIKIIRKSVYRPKPRPNRLLGVAGVILALVIIWHLPVFQSQPSWAAAKGLELKSKDNPTQQEATTPSLTEYECKIFESVISCDAVKPSLQELCKECKSLYGDKGVEAFWDKMMKEVEYWNSFYRTITGGPGLSGSGGKTPSLPGGEDDSSGTSQQLTPQPDQQSIEPPANNSLEQWRAFIERIRQQIWDKWARKVAHRIVCQQKTAKAQQCVRQSFNCLWANTVGPIQKACETQVRSASCHIIRRNGKDIEDCSGLDEKKLAACKNLPPKGYLCPLPITTPQGLSYGLPDNFSSTCISKRYWLAENMPTNCCKDDCNAGDIVYGDCGSSVNCDCGKGGPSDVHRACNS